MVKNNKTRKRTTSKNYKVFTYADYNSGDGMLTTVWGPSLWHYLHTICLLYTSPSPRDED